MNYKTDHDYPFSTPTKNAVNKKIYAKDLKFCIAAVFVVCQRDNHKTDFYYTIVILKNQGAYMMYSSIFLKKDSTHPLTNREKGVIIHTIFFKRYDREK